MKKIIFLVAVILSSCNQADVEIKDNTENQKKFETNVENFNSMIDAFAAEDQDRFMNIFADSLKWSGPDKKNMSEFDSKEVLAKALNGYMAAYDNHALKNTRFFAGSTFSTMQANDSPDVIRVYGCRFFLIKMVKSMNFGTILTWVVFFNNMKLNKNNS